MAPPQGAAEAREASAWLGKLVLVLALVLLLLAHSSCELTWVRCGWLLHPALCSLLLLALLLLALVLVRPPLLAPCAVLAAPTDLHTCGASPHDSHFKTQLWKGDQEVQMQLVQLVRQLLPLLVLLLPVLVLLLCCCGHCWYWFQHWCRCWC